MTRSYQTKSDDECDVSFLTRSIMIASDFIPCTSSTGPVHAGNSESQEASYYSTSNYVIQPRSTPVEEETKG